MRHASLSAVRVFVYYDYLCPHSFLVLRRLEMLQQEESLLTFWRPLVLGSPPNETGRTTALVASDDEPVSTIALLAAQFARDVSQSAFDRLHARLFEAVHEEGRDIGRQEEVLAVAAECRIDPAALERSLDDGRYRQELELARDEAERYGITATPTLLFGRYKLIGAAPLEELRRAAALAASEL